LTDLQRHAWVPEDYARIRRKVRPGESRYGLEWFDGPQRPADVFDPVVAARFPSAFLVGRRHGQFVGYEEVDSGRPALREWGGSQRHVVRRYAGIDELILSQRAADSDRRPVVPHALDIPGMAFGAWHDAGTGLTADCILSPGLEARGLDHLLDRLDIGWELILVRSDNDSWLSVRRQDGGFELLDARHGSVGDWRGAARAAAFAELVALAPFNDGSLPQYFARLIVPRTGGT
jgi:hypothetical protein